MPNESKSLFPARSHDKSPDATMKRNEDELYTPRAHSREFPRSTRKPCRFQVHSCLW